jgi:hypothetical protein
VLCEEAGTLAAGQRKVARLGECLFRTGALALGCVGSYRCLSSNISKSHLTWRITPKDSKRRTAVPIRFLIPYLLIIFFCGVAAVVYEPNPATRGYFWFTLFNAVCYVVLLTVILYFNARESSTTESIAMPNSITL